MFLITVNGKASTWRLPYQGNSRKLRNSGQTHLEVLYCEGLCETQDQLSPQLGAGSLPFITAKHDVVIIKPSRLSIRR